MFIDRRTLFGAFGLISMVALIGINAPASDLGLDPGTTIAASPAPR